MEIKIEIPEYYSDKGITYNWEDGFEIEVKKMNLEVIISANKAGLISLANHFLNLAQDKIPSGSHLHFDQNNSLEENSLELVIEKRG
jgi:hypothetical protein